MNTKEENLKIVHDELIELHRQHQSGIELVCNKLNWILVSDVVFLAAVYDMRHRSILVVVLVSLSAIFSLVGFKKRKFNITQRITSQLKNLEAPDFLEVLVKKKLEAFNGNEAQNKEVGDIMHYASWLLIAAIILQGLLLIIR